MAVVLQAPTYSEKPLASRSIFIAGGITNCPNWQNEVISKLIDFPDLVIFNPRRESFDVSDPAAVDQQIEWEYKHLKEADMILFWFSEGSLNPIVLFDYGLHGRLGYPTDGGIKRVFVGIHPDYPRAFDVRKQTALAHGPKVCNSIDELVQLVRTHISNY